ncbi:MAG: nucleoside triphosphate pyrophosphohydrolase [Bacteroidales bacterium]|nr:nucleoside triphosphate pyrophosphohydrolase [Bacteroidales bacterium]
MQTTDIKHKKEVLAFDRMLTLMEKVRNECPWDHAQTNSSLRTLTIEELYELSQAVLDENDNEICKELGDVMMHVVFYALIGKEKGVFDITDVLNLLCEKLIRRHPHVFNKDMNLTAQDVEKNWERIKLKEGNRSTFSGVPDTLPSLIKAHRLQDKASGIGFDFNRISDAWEKVKEEMDELQSEVKLENNAVKVNEEFGDLLLALINYARFININPDTALETANKKFKRRFEYMENAAKAKGSLLQNMSTDEMEELWQESKRQGL